MKSPKFPKAQNKAAVMWRCERGPEPLPLFIRAAITPEEIKARRRGRRTGRISSTPLSECPTLSFKSSAVLHYMMLNAGRHISCHHLGSPSCRCSSQAAILTCTCVFYLMSAVPKGSLLCRRCQSCSPDCT